MDSISQFVLGASVGEAIAGRKIGNKAILWGGIAGTIPDLDVLMAPFYDHIEFLLVHRGFSHSLLFCFLGAPVFASILSSKGRKLSLGFNKWMKLFFWCFLTHILLDCCTMWGTQVFWPFNYRVAFNSVFIMDPIYTVPFLLALLVILFLKRENNFRSILNWGVLTFTTFYLLVGIGLKVKVNNKFKTYCRENEIEYSRFMTNPMPLTTIYWYGWIQTEKEWILGYYSFLNGEPYFIHYPNNTKNNIEERLNYNEEFEILKRVSHGFYRIDEFEDGLRYTDLRFGLRKTWNGIEEYDPNYGYKINLDSKNNITSIKRMPMNMEYFTSHFDQYVDVVFGHPPFEKK